MEWNRSTILHFISLIKERPAIWDYHSPEYKMKRKRHQAVEEVALLMGVTPKEVSTKWIILRNQYSRERRKITETSTETPYVTKWYAYKDMDSLMIQPKISFRSFWNQESKTDDEDSSQSSPPPPPPSRPSSSNMRNDQNIDNVAQTSLSICTQAIKTLNAMREQNNHRTNDELTNYGLYIAAHLKRFSPPLQSRAKYEINKILYALDLESMGEYSATISNADDDEVTIARESKFDPLRNHKD